MSRHPCADHLDHCYSCDFLGICCASLLPAQRELLAASAPARWDRLRAAIAQDAETVPSLPELVRQEARLLPASVRLGLCAAPTADPVSHDSRKEPIHVIPARSK
jgi:hypothetical protein